MSALRLLMTNKEPIFDVIDLFRNLIDVAHFGTYKLNLSTHLWGLNGCHELLAALGFELAHVHENKIVLAAGKNIHRNQIDFVLQTLLTIFGNILDQNLKLCFPKVNISNWYKTLRYLRSTEKPTD